jgi:hypothetical protein
MAGKLFMRIIHRFWIKAINVETVSVFALKVHPPALSTHNVKKYFVFNSLCNSRSIDMGSFSGFW